MNNAELKSYSRVSVKTRTDEFELTSIKFLKLAFIVDFFHNPNLSYDFHLLSECKLLTFNIITLY